MNKFGWMKSIANINGWTEIAQLNGLQARPGSLASYFFTRSPQYTVTME